MITTPTDERTFERARAELLDRFGDWAGGREVQPWVLEETLRHKWACADGHLTRWSVIDLSDVMLSHLPRKVMPHPLVGPGIVTTLHAFVDFLSASGLLDFGSDPVPVLHEGIDTAALQLDEAIEEAAESSPVAALVDAMLDDGVNLEDDDAIAAWLERFDKLPVDEQLAVMGSPPDEFPRVELPPADELTEMAADSSALARLRILVDFVGDGRPLTKKGNLKLDDGKSLVALLGTDDRIDEVIGDTTFRTRSSEELVDVDFTYRWAKASGFVRVRHGKVLSTKAGRAIASRPLDSWLRAFDGLLKMGIAAHRRPSFWAQVLDRNVPGLFKDLYRLQHTLATADIASAAWLNVERTFDLSDTTATQREFFEACVASDCLSIVGRFAELGVLEWSGYAEEESYGRRVRTGGEVALSPLGIHAIRQMLLREGYDVPAAGELVEADAWMLLTACIGLDRDETLDEVSRWIAARPTEQAVEDLAAVARDTDDLVLRTVALVALGAAAAEAEPAVRAMVDHPSAGVAARVWLVQHGFDEGAVIGEHAPDLLVEALALLLHGGEPEMVGFLQSLGPDHEVAAEIEELWRVPAPHTERVLEAIAHHHPAKVVAKAARKALFKRRSVNN